MAPTSTDPGPATTATEPGTRGAAVSRWGRTLGALTLSGAGCAIGARLGPLAPLATCVSLVPWILVLDAALDPTGTPPGPTGGHAVPRLRTAAALAAVMAAVFVVAVFPWFPGAVVRYSGASPALVWGLFFLLSPLLAPGLLAFAAARWAVRRAEGGEARAAVAACAAFVAVDALCPKLFFDTLGIGLYPSALLRQGAALAGVYGLTVLALAVNELIAAAVRRWMHHEHDRRAALRRASVPLAAAAALLLVAAAGGAARLSAQSARLPERTVLLGAVQANLTAYEKLRAEEGAAGAMAAILGKHIGMSRAILAGGPVDALVWPETVYPTTFGAPKGEGAAVFEEALRDLVRTSATPLIFGAYEADGPREHNAMFFVEPRPAAPPPPAPPAHGLNTASPPSGPSPAPAAPVHDLNTVPLPSSPPPDAPPPADSAYAQNTDSPPSGPSPSPPSGTPSERTSDDLNTAPGSPGGDLLVQSYRKRMLFPMTEYVPELLDGPWLRRMLPWTGRWSRGPGARVVRLGLAGGEAVTVVPLLCYDAVVPSHVAEGASLGADLLLTLSNDAWFPSEQAAELHLASAALRSVETGLPQVRVTVSGISAVVAPTGELLVKSGWESEARLRVEVPLSPRTAPLALLLAPWIGPLAAAVCLTLLLARRRPRSGASVASGPRAPGRARARRQG